MPEEDKNTNPLMAGLRASLRVVEDIDPTDDSPLREATADSINTLLDEINNNLAEGMPEKTTDEQLYQMVDMFRAQAATWVTQEVEKQNKPRRGRKGKPDKFESGDLLDIEF